MKPSVLRLIVTAGPTREHLDPVRFLSNPSTGKMGFAIAEAAARKGVDIILIAGPVSLKTPKGVRRVDVVSARDMLAAVELELSLAKNDNVVLVSTAAVADWRPKVVASKKLKKQEMSGTLELVRNPDILKTVHRHFPKARLVGFAAETGNPHAEANRKCREKGLSFIVANDVTEPGAGFGVDTNRVALIFPDGACKKLPLMTKRMVARRIIGEILK